MRTRLSPVDFENPATISESSGMESCRRGLGGIHPWAWTVLLLISLISIELPVLQGNPLVPDQVDGSCDESLDTTTEDNFFAGRNSIEEEDEDESEEAEEEIDWDSPSYQAPRRGRSTTSTQFQILLWMILVQESSETVSATIQSRKSSSVKSSFLN